MKFILKFKQEDRPSIDEVIRHPTFVKHRETFYEPLKESDLKLLVKNFMINSGNGKGRTLPDVIHKLAQQFNKKKKVEKSKKQAQ